MLSEDANIASGVDQYDLQHEVGRQIHQEREVAPGPRIQVVVYAPSKPSVVPDNESNASTGSPMQELEDELSGDNESVDEAMDEYESQSEMDEDHSEDQSGSEDAPAVRRQKRRESSAHLRRGRALSDSDDTSAFRERTPRRKDPKDKISPETRNPAPQPRSLNGRFGRKAPEDKRPPKTPNPAPQPRSLNGRFGRKAPEDKRPPKTPNPTPQPRSLNGQFCRKPVVDGWDPRTPVDKTPRRRKSTVASERVTRNRSASDSATGTKNVELLEISSASSAAAFRPKHKLRRINGKFAPESPDSGGDSRRNSPASASRLSRSQPRINGNFGQKSSAPTAAPIEEEIVERPRRASNYSGETRSQSRESCGHSVATRSRTRPAARLAADDTSPFETPPPPIKIEPLLASTPSPIHYEIETSSAMEAETHATVSTPMLKHLKVEIVPASAKTARPKRPPAKSPFFQPTSLPKTPSKSKSRKGVSSTKSSPNKRSPAGLVSCIQFPPLSAPHFGLIQEKLAHDPFRLLIAVTFLIRTHGKHAIPVFYELMESYPTPESLVAADKEDIVSIIRHLGLQNSRAATYQTYAKIWLKDPPTKDRRYAVRDYPERGAGRDIPRDQLITDDDPRQAWEIGHMTSGSYALDSWRIFCRDILRGVAESWNGEGAKQEGFQPEWMRVLPEDKELRAYLRWMWLKEGFEWDPFTGDKDVASLQLTRAAMEGRIAWDDRGGMRILEEAANEAADQVQGGLGGVQVKLEFPDDDDSTGYLI